MPRRGLLLLISVWTAVGCGLWFFDDFLEARLWVVALLPWIVWALAGLLLFGLALKASWRAKWRAGTIVTAILVPLSAATLMLAGPPLAVAGSRLICCAHPSDLALIENFRAHHDEFESIHTMFLADQSMGRIAPTWSSPALLPTGVLAPGSAVSDERLARYRELFRTTGLHAGIGGDYQRAHITLMASTRGLVVSGSMKGYAILAATPALLVQDLDSYRPPDHSSFTAYRHLEGHWYLVFQYDD